MTSIGSADWRLLGGTGGFFRRHARLIIATCVVGLLAGLPLSLARTPSYTSSTRILVERATADPLTGTGLSADPARVLQTEALVVTGREVRRLVVAKLGAAPQVTVGPLPQSDVLAVTATGSDPERAAEVADAYAEAYVQFRRSDATDELKSQQLSLFDQLDTLTTRREEAAGDATRLAELDAQRTALRGRLATVENQLRTVTAGVSILNGASTPHGDRFIVLVRTAVLTGSLAFLVALGLALLRDRSLTARS